MKKLQKFFRKIPSRYLILAMIVAVAVSCITVSGTFASFQTTVIGTGETPVANWDFQVKINGDEADANSRITGVRLAGDEDKTYHMSNRDANDQIPEYLLAAGTAGYMPVEIDGTASKVSMLVTVKAYFADLPAGFVFYDNLGNELTITPIAKANFTPALSELEVTKIISTNTAKTFADVQGYSMITYNYYISHSEVTEWASMTGDNKYLDIGFRWAWVDDGTNQNYDASHMYGEIQVTGQQVTNANQIDGITAINFVGSATDFKFGDVLNVTHKALGNTTVTATGDFYLDVMADNLSANVGKVSGKLTVDATASAKVVLGTTRKETGYNTGTLPTVELSNTSNITSLSISDDFDVDILKMLNNVADIDDEPTLFDALTLAVDATDGLSASDKFIIAKLFNNDVAIDSVDALANCIANNSIVWNSLTKQFEKETTADVKYFKVYSAMPATQSYSIYLAGTAATGNIVVTVGFDAGLNTGIDTVEYNRSNATTGQNVIIRTCSFDTAITVNAPLDVVKHFDKAGTLNVIKVADSSYHEYGIVPFVEIANGRLALESGSFVEHIHVSNKLDANLEKEENEFDSIVIAKASDVEQPTFSRDAATVTSVDILVVEIQYDTNNDDNTESNYIWLSKQGIYEQIMVSDNKEGNNKEYVYGSEKSDDTKQAAQDIANLYSGARNASTNNIEDVVIEGETTEENVTVQFNYDTREFEVNSTVATTADDAAKLAAVTAVKTNNIEQSVLTNEKREEIIATAKEDAIDEVCAQEEEKNYVARIGTTGYTTLTDAFTAAVAGDTIRLIANEVELANTITIDKNVTLDLNEKTISIQAASWAFTNNGANFTVKNGTFVDGANGACWGLFNHLAGTGSTIAYDLTIGSNNAQFITDQGSIFRIRGGNTLDLDNVTIYTDDRGITADGDTKNTVYVDNCAMTITDTSSGTAIIAGKNTDFTINKLTVNSQRNGIDIECGSTATISNTTINCPNRNPMYAYDSTATLNNCTLSAGMNCIGVAGEGSVTVNGGTYTAAGTGTNAVLKVYNTGGQIDVNSGSFTYTGSSDAYVAFADSRSSGAVNVGTDAQPCIINMMGGTITGYIGFQHKAQMTFSGTAHWNGTVKLIGDAGINYLEITGGTFVNDPTQYVADGYEVEQSEGIYAVVKTPTAKIVDTKAKYNTLGEAVAAATAGQTVKLFADVNERLANIAKGITIDLNGHTVTNNVKDSYVVGVTSTDLVTIKNGTLVNDYTKNIILCSGGNLKIEGITATSNGASIFVNNNNGTMTVDKDCNLTANTGTYGYGISNAASLYIKDGAVINIISGNSNGAEGIYNGVNATLDISGGTITFTGSGSYNYDYAVYGDGTVNISGGTLTVGEGCSFLQAATFAIKGNGAWTISGGTISGEYIRIASNKTPSLVISGGTINAQLQGALSYNGTITVTGGTFAKANSNTESSISNFVDTDTYSVTDDGTSIVVAAK